MSLLSVAVKKARFIGPQAAQWTSYVTLKLQSVKSTTVPVKGDSPSWEQDFLFEINNVETGLLIEVWNKGMLWDKVVGYIYLHLRHIHQSNEEGEGQWIPIDGELMMHDGVVMGTKSPTGHYILVDARFEVPLAAELENGDQLQYKLEMLNSMMDQESRHHGHEQSRRQQQYYIQSGISEDSDYTSDVNYPTGQHPNSSASQFLQTAHQLRTPQRSLNSSRENSYEVDDDYRNQQQQQHHGYGASNHHRQHRRLPQPQPALASSSMHNQPLEQYPDHYHHTQGHQDQYWDESRGDFETDQLYYNSRPPSKPYKYAGYTRNETYSTSYDGYFDEEQQPASRSNQASSLRNNRRSGTQSLERQDTLFQGDDAAGITDYHQPKLDSGQGYQVPTSSISSKPEVYPGNSSTTDAYDQYSYNYYNQQSDDTYPQNQPQDPYVESYPAYDDQQPWAYDPPVSDHTPHQQYSKSRKELPALPAVTTVTTIATSTIPSAHKTSITASIAATIASVTNLNKAHTSSNLTDPSYSVVPTLVTDPYVDPYTPADQSMYDEQYYNNQYDPKSQVPVPDAQQGYTSTADQGGYGDSSYTNTAGYDDASWSYNGYYDETGNFISYDDNSYYDEAGNLVPYSASTHQYDQFDTETTDVSAVLGSKEVPPPPAISKSAKSSVIPVHHSEMDTSTIVADTEYDRTDDSYYYDENGQQYSYDEYYNNYSIDQGPDYRDYDNNTSTKAASELPHKGHHTTTRLSEIHQPVSTTHTTTTTSTFSTSTTPAIITTSTTTTTSLTGPMKTSAQKQRLQSESSVDYNYAYESAENLSYGNTQDPQGLNASTTDLERSNSFIRRNRLHRQASTRDYSLAGLDGQPIPNPTTNLKDPADYSQSFDEAANANAATDIYGQKNHVESVQKFKNGITVTVQDTVDLGYSQSMSIDEDQYNNQGYWDDQFQDDGQLGQDPYQQDPYGQYDNLQQNQVDPANAGPVHMDSLESNVSEGARDPENDNFEAEYWNKQRERIEKNNAYTDYQAYNESLDKSKPPFFEPVMDSPTIIMGGATDGLTEDSVPGFGGPSSRRTSTTQDDWVNGGGSKKNSLELERDEWMSGLERKGSQRSMRSLINRQDTILDSHAEEDEEYGICDGDEMDERALTAKMQHRNSNSDSTGLASPTRKLAMLNDIQEDGGGLLIDANGILVPPQVSLELPGKDKGLKVSFGEDGLVQKVPERVTKGMTPREKWLWSMNRICSQLAVSDFENILATKR